MPPFGDEFEEEELEAPLPPSSTSMLWEEQLAPDRLKQKLFSVFGKDFVLTNIGPNEMVALFLKVRCALRYMKWNTPQWDWSFEKMMELENIEALAFARLARGRMGFERVMMTTQIQRYEERSYAFTKRIGEMLWGRRRHEEEL